MRFLTFIIVVLALAGVVVSTLALKEHYNTEASPCKINDKWDCGAVNHSPYAVFYGVPVATIGIIGYALLAAIAGRFPILTALAALGALGFALWLTSIEARVLLVWCIYCVTSQVIIAIITVLACVAVVLNRRRPA
jgi:uncharacterized membrane protein